MTSPYGHTQVQGTARVLEPPTFCARSSATANIADLDSASTAQGGVTLEAGDLILLTEQSDASENGLYAYGTVQAGAAGLTRIHPFVEGDELTPGTVVYVAEGTRGGKRYQCTVESGVEVGSDDITFAELLSGATLASSTLQVNVALAAGILAAGTPLAAFADNAASNPGITLANSKAVALRWNNNATQTAVWYSVPLPQDLDADLPVALHLLASKSGATLADATTFTIVAFFQTPGALHDADTDAGGVTNAMTGDAAAKTVAELTRTIAAVDVPASPSALSFSIKPTDGTLGTDDALVEGIWIEYTPKSST